MDFPAKETWSSGIVVSKTGPVSGQVKLENRTVVRRHQDHIKNRDQKVVMPSSESDTREEVPVIWPESATAPPTPEFSESGDTQVVISRICGGT